MSTINLHRIFNPESVAVIGASEKEGSVTIDLPYDKSLVAARLGMKPESLSRALAKLRLYGVTTNGHKIELSDIVKLREFCISGE